MKKCISLKDLGIEVTKDTKIILRSRPLGRECPVLKEVREYIKNNPKEAEDNGWCLIDSKNLVDVDGVCDFCKEKAEEHGAVKVMCEHKY